MNGKAAQPLTESTPAKLHCGCGTAIVRGSGPNGGGRAPAFVVIVVRALATVAVIAAYAVPETTRYRMGAICDSNLNVPTRRHRTEIIGETDIVTRDNESFGGLNAY